MRLRRALYLLVLAAGHLFGAATTDLVVQSGHGSIKSVAYSHDGRLIVTGGAHIAILWDAATGSELRVFSGHTGDVISAVFSTSGSLVLTASNDGTARIWETATGREVRRIPPPRAEIASKGEVVHSFLGVRSAAFSTDDRHIFTGGVDGRVREWNAASGILEREFSTVRGNVLAISNTCVAPSPEGRLLLTGVMNGNVEL
jgi:WD40 repeat protein